VVYMYMYGAHREFSAHHGHAGKEHCRLHSTSRALVIAIEPTVTRCVAAVLTFGDHAPRGPGPRRRTLAGREHCPLEPYM
jgi:hypothetical protein